MAHDCERPVCSWKSSAPYLEVARVERFSVEANIDARHTLDA